MSVNPSFILSDRVCLLLQSSIDLEADLRIGRHTEVAARSRTGATRPPVPPSIAMTVSMPVRTLITSIECESYAAGMTD